MSGEGTAKARERETLRKTAKRRKTLEIKVSPVYQALPSTATN
jgi:hypothetical protein